MTLRLVQLPGGRVLLTDGSEAVAVDRICRMRDFTADKEAPPMVRYEVGDVGYGFLAASLAEVLDVFEQDAVVEAPSEEELSRRRKAAADRIEAIKYRSAG